MNGVLLVNKPQGFTSFDVVAVARKICSQKKIGHTGTLDPNATGVLVLLLGNATKAQDIIPNHDKEYTASFRLGITTDTLDIWGKTLSQNESSVTREQLEAALADFRGEIEQIPPMYSAVSVNGQRLYDLARKGVEVEREPRKITVYELELLSFDEGSQSGSLRVMCSKGTYIRTLIDDLGKALKTGAAMTALNRTAACGFRLESCITLDELRALGEKGEIETVLSSCESLFASYPFLTVSDAQARRFSNGGYLDPARTALAQRKTNDGEIIRIKNRTGDFLGLGVIKDEKLKIFKLF